MNSKDQHQRWFMNVPWTIICSSFPLFQRWTLLLFFIGKRSSPQGLNYWTCQNPFRFFHRFPSTSLQFFTASRALADIPTRVAFSSCERKFHRNHLMSILLFCERFPWQTLSLSHAKNQEFHIQVIKGKQQFLRFFGWKTWKRENAEDASIKKCQLLIYDIFLKAPFEMSSHFSAIFRFERHENAIKSRIYFFLDGFKAFNKSTSKPFLWRNKNIFKPE